MKRIRQAVTCFCLVTTLSASIPCRAESGGASRVAEPGSTPIGQGASKLDLSRLQKKALWSDKAMASPEAPVPLKVRMQRSGGGWSSLSAAKKTWIIVGIVVGTAAVVAVVSNSGDGNGGGGY